MNNRTDILVRIAAGIAFLGLAFLSCSWTANSFYIWQKDLTWFGAWGIAICFYALVSGFFSTLLKCTEKYPKFMFFSNPKSAFIVSVLIIVVFWMWFGLATNTHYFIYKSEIKEVVTPDLKLCKKYLECMNLHTCNPKIKTIEDEKNQLTRSVQDILLRLRKEIDRRGANGIGPYFMAAYNELQSVLMAHFQTQIDKVITNKQECELKFQEISHEANDFLALRIKDFDNKIVEIEKEIDSPKINKLISNLGTTYRLMEENDYSIESVQMADKDLNDAFSHIKTYSNCISFDGNDRDYFSRDGAILKCNELKNPSSIWWDYITTDKYSGHGFLWKIMLSLLVDLAAFIFCYIAFNYKSTK